jgi:hypothetical protein
LATLQCWTKRIKAPCVRLHAVYRRIQVAELTGGPYSDESMHRLATAIFNSKDGESTQLFSHAYDIIRNEHYVIGPPFPVPSAYDFLAKKTNLLADGMEELTPVVAEGAGGAAVDELTNDGAAGGVEPISHGLLTKRPSSGGVKSTKAAKRAKHAKTQAGADAELYSMNSLVTAVSDMESSRSSGQAANTAALERQVAVQEADLRLRTFQVLYGQGSSASSDERRTVESAMRTTFAQSILVPPQPQLCETPVQAICTALSIPSTPRSPRPATRTPDALALQPPFSAGDGTRGIRLDLYDDNSNSVDD